MTTLRVKLLILIAELMLSASGYARDVWFAPEEDCTAVIVREINKAARTVDVMAYNFTSQPIGDALIRAEARKVEVRIVLDRRATSQRNSQAQRCKAAGAEVRIDRRHPIAHSKVSIIDGKTLLGGSFNYSRQANRNAENLTLEDDPSIVAKFQDNFQEHAKHSVKY